MTKKKVGAEAEAEAEVEGKRSIWLCEECHWNIESTMPKPEKCEDCNSDRIVKSTP